MDASLPDDASIFELEFEILFSQFNNNHFVYL